MSYIQEIEFDFHVGDQYDVTPIEGTYLIGKILAIGGECYLDGNIVVVSELPASPAPVPETVEPPEPEPELPNISPEPTVFEKTFAETPYVPNVVEEAIADSYDADSDTTLPEEEEPPVVKAAPIKRARKTKKEDSIPSTADVEE